MNKLQEREMRTLVGGGDGTACGIAVGFAVMAVAVNWVYGLLWINRAMVVCMLDLA